MDWLTQDFQEHTVVWLLITSVLGGIVGALVKFTFEDVLGPLLGRRRDVRKVARTYTTPLVRSAESLERRINNFVRNRDAGWYDGTDEYYRLSTLYVFAEHLAWVHILEKEFGFLPFESGRAGKEFSLRLNGLFRALTSFSYFQWPTDPPNVKDVESSQVPRFMLRAIGETSLDPAGSHPLEFTAFVVKFGQDEQYRRWFKELDDVLVAAASGADSLALDRLIAAGANLRALIRFLDPRGRLVTLRPMVNLLIAHRPVSDALLVEFPDLIPQHWEDPRPAGG